MTLSKRGAMLLCYACAPDAPVANLPWFDTVLVDIGDSQDLMQSLSTFSARLAKQRAILSAANPRSLVLMAGSRFRVRV